MQQNDEHKRLDRLDLLEIGLMDAFRDVTPARLWTTVGILSLSLTAFMWVVIGYLRQYGP